MLSRWTLFTVRHHWAVLACWAVVLASLGIFTLVAGSRFVDAFTIPGAESQDMMDLLKERFPAQAGNSATLVFEAEDGVNDPSIRQRIEGALSEAARLPEVTNVASPYRTPGEISEDGTIAYATVQYGKPAEEVDKESVEELEDLAARTNGSGLVAEAGGIVVSNTESAPPGESELIGLAAAVIVLLIAFGSVAAMSLPVVTALVGLGTGSLIIALITHVMDISTFTPAFASMIGLGVGTDYALFIVTRYRESLAGGYDVTDSVARALDTAGRAVIAAGVVVVIAVLGLFTIGIPFVTALGVAAAIVVGLAVLVAITLLPALLGLVGRKIDSLKVPGLRAAGEGRHHDTISYRFSRAIQRAPLLCALGSAVLLSLLTAPLLDMRLGFSDDGNKSTSFESRRAYDRLSKGFGPGFNGPLFVAVEEAGGLDSETLNALAGGLAGARNVERVTPPVPNEAGDTAVITVFPSTSPQDERTPGIVEDLRQNVVPEATRGSGATAYVGGPVAAFIDINGRIVERMPLFFSLVIGLSFLLLMAVFRSVVVPLKAAVMNLLSIGAAYGALVAVFQWGWGERILGTKAGPIETFLPMMLFAILFGLSMDYEVFLVSRIRESFLKSGDARGSVAEGLAVTARIITAAAAIMIFVFLSFVLGDDRIIKEFGLGLATAILVDATIIRLVLVPSTMTLLGRYNWSFPHFLDVAIPKLNIEGGSSPAPAPSPEKLVLSGLSLEYLARKIENADGESPNLVRTAASLVPEPRGEAEAERARLAAREIIRPLALRTILIGIQTNGTTSVPRIGGSAPSGFLSER